MSRGPLVLLTILALLVAGGCDIFDDDDDDRTVIDQNTYTGRTTGPLGSAVVITVAEHTSRSTTGGVMAAVVNTFGVLMPDGDDPIDITGSYDTASRTVTASGGGYTFDGFLARGQIAGTYSGPGGSGDFQLFIDGTRAPYHLVLGMYDTSSTATLTCPERTFEESGMGLLRLRMAVRQLTLDTWDGENCEVNDDLYGSWSGAVYTETETDTQQFGPCALDEMEQTLRVEFAPGSFSGTLTGTGTISQACEIDGTMIAAGTVCDYSQTLTATRCTDCWPANCEPP